MGHPATRAARRLWILGLAILPLTLFALNLRPTNERAPSSLQSDIAVSRDSLAPGTYRYKRPDGGIATTVYLAPQRYFKMLEYDGRRELAQGAFAGDTYSVYYLEQHIIKGVGDAEEDLVPEFRLLDEVFLRGLRSGAVAEAGLVYEASAPPADYPAEALPVPSVLVVGQGEGADRWQLLDYTARVDRDPEVSILELISRGFGVTIDTSAL